VPATVRNADMLALYARGVVKDFRCVFFRCSVFSKNSDIGGDVRKILRFPVIYPFFLRGKPAVSQWQILWIMISRQQQLRAVLRKIAPVVVVAGNDNLGAGSWLTHNAKKLGIPTLACQEGFYNPAQMPLIVKAKRLVYSWVSYFYKPIGALRYFSHADFAAAWGEYDRRMAIKDGLNGERIFVIGDPRIQKRSSPRLSEAIARALILDIPATALPKGTFDMQALWDFRADVLKELLKLSISVQYRPHPLTPDNERNRIYAMISRSPDVQIDTKSNAQESIVSADICLTYPSTSVTNILAAGVPLIFLKPRIQGFSRVFLDPIRDYGVGIGIESAYSIKSAIKQVLNASWQEKYIIQSLKVAEDIVGPLDGKASERFAISIKAISEGMLQHEAK